MFTGVGVLGVVAGSLSALFGFDKPSVTDEPGTPVSVVPRGAQPVHAELAALRTQLQAVESRLGELADRARTDSGALE